MPGRTFLIRVLCLLGMALWAGGFAFYGAAVVPVLHEELDALQAGEITRRVTVALNAVGLATLIPWWWACVTERAAGPPRLRRARLVLLGASSALLAFQLALHRVMDGRLDAGALRGFYPLHRAYLIGSTAQWFANLGLLAASLRLWTAGDRPD